MANDKMYVEVELIADPRITRRMTPESFKQNQAKWALINGSDQEVQGQIKKHAAPVASEEKNSDEPFNVGITEATKPKKVGKPKSKKS